MDHWKIQLVVVTFCTLMQSQQGISSTVEEERGLSRDWQIDSPGTDRTLQIASLMKKAKAFRFYGLMGKRSGTKMPFQIKRRNKGGMFVGLMGRSLSSGETITNIIPSATTTGMDDSEKTLKQGSSEEWIQILY